MKHCYPTAVAARVLSCILLFLLFSSTVAAQTNQRIGKVTQRVQELKKQGAFPAAIPLFKIVSAEPKDQIPSSTLKKYTLIESDGLQNIQQVKPSYLRLVIPIENGERSFEVLLYNEHISGNGFTLKTEKGDIASSYDVANYRGAINDDPSSLVALTFANNEVSGYISNNDGNYVIGKLGNSVSRHIIYNDADLTQQDPFVCGTNTFLPESAPSLARTNAAAAVATKCVNWYWETDYDLFVNKGSVAAVNAYIQAVFNQMATLYANDGITVTLKTLFVWSTEDPYTGTSTSGYLTQFGNYRTSFDGDLAHLIGLKGGGGVAWINGVCKTTKYRMAYSGISSSYQTVPTYSWTVECISHEQGHLLGSQHTHDCAWNGNNTKIDGCGDAAGYSSGSCAVPALPSAGTIMSYCHLTNVGINFNLGFGAQPTERMINTINAGSCLTACNTCTTPSQPAAITGTVANCVGSAQVYSVPPVIGATSYTWSLPPGWTGASASNSITVTVGSANGNISVIANNSCGSGSARILAVTASSTPAAPATVSGNVAVCAGTSQVYTVSTVAGATSYVWTLPQGWTGTSTTNTITVTTGTTGGQLTVKAANACGQSAAKAVTLSITSVLPGQPGVISGNASVCAGSAQSYSVAAVAGATSYSWTLPQGWSGTSSSNTINTTAGDAGSISVRAINGCGTSTARTLAVTTSPLPAAPGPISVSGGTATVCSGNTRTYTTPLVSGLSYNWTIPAGATVVSGQNTNVLQLSFGSSFVSASVLSVKASNGCGSSPATSITISKSTLATPGAISGSATSCPNNFRQYSVAAVSGATSYLWTIPPGSAIWGSATGRTIWVRLGSTSGNITVKAVSACGTSAASSKLVTITCSSGIVKSGFEGPAIIYPNPARDKATIRFNASAQETCVLTITDIAGKIISTRKLTAMPGINTSPVEVAGYLPGVYLIRLKGTTINEVLKLNIN